MERAILRGILYLALLGNTILPPQTGRSVTDGTRDIVAAITLGALACSASRGMSLRGIEEASRERNRRWIEHNEGSTKGDA
jgi:hypothetical protein